MLRVLGPHCNFSDETRFKQKLPKIFNRSVKWNDLMNISKFGSVTQ